MQDAQQQWRAVADRFRDSLPKLVKIAGAAISRLVRAILLERNGESSLNRRYL